MIALVLAAALAVSSDRGTTIVAQPNATANLIGTEIVLGAGADRQSPDQNGLAALVAESILQTPVASGTTLASAVNDAGGSISYAIDPHDVRFYLEALPSSYRDSLGLLHKALVSPGFSAAGLAKARDVLDAKIAGAQTQALQVGIAMLNRTFYQNSDAGLPPFGVSATLARFGTSDASQFYRTMYRRGGAIVSSAGVLDAAGIAAAAHVLDGLPLGSSAPYSVQTPKIASLTHQLIARRDVPVAWLVAQYPAPDIRSADFGPMLVLSSFVQRTLADVSSTGTPIATQSSALRGVGALYNYDSQPANLIVYIDGGASDPTRAFATALTVVNVLGHAKLEGDLSEMKSYAAGRFLLSTTTLQQQAFLAGVFAANHMPGDYISAGIAAINRTTSKDLQRVALRYLGNPTVALILPRNQLPNVGP